MKKYRLIYGGVLLVTCLLLFIMGNKYLLALALFEVALVIVLCALLHMEAMTLKPVLHVRNGCVVGELCPMVFELERKMPCIATGILDVQVEFHNVLYGRSTLQELKIPGTLLQEQYEIQFQPVSCGEEHIICREIVCYDIFGITSIHLKPLTEQVVTVVPKPVPVQLIEGEIPAGQREGEQFDYTKKGNDRTEVYDLRDYLPGDDVRSIHWKLSGKIDKLLVKEAGYSSHYDTLVLFDTGLGKKEKRWSEAVVSGAMELAVTFSQKLLELQRPHYVAALMKDTFEIKEIASNYDYIQLVNQNMGVSLPEQTGGALAHFLLQGMEHDFSRIIYIVAGGFSDALYRLAEETEITAVCVTDEKEEIYTVEKGRSRLIEIPQRQLYDQVHYFYI